MKAHPLSHIIPSVSLLLGVLAGPSAAQAPGIPVYGGGFSPTIELEGVVGFPTSDSPTGDGLAIGATGTLSLGRVGVWATAGRFLASGDGVDDRLVYGAMAGIKIIGGPLTPLGVYLQGGAGAMEDGDPDTSTVYYPVGLAATLTIPTPYVSVRPWIAPRADITRTTTGGTSETDNVFAISAGVDLTLLTGLSFRASYDKIKDLDGTVGFGVALHF